jgi:hypothetical protein
MDEIHHRRVEAGYLDDDRHEADTRAVLELFRQLSSTPVPALNLSESGFSTDEIRRRAERLLTEIAPRPPKSRAVRKRLRDVAAVERSIARRFEPHGHIVDRVHCTIVVQVGTRELTAKTRIDGPLALPWTVDGKQTWNARISDLVATLTPKRNFFDRARPLLSLSTFADRTAKHVLDEAEEAVLASP